MTTASIERRLERLEKLLQQKAEQNQTVNKTVDKTSPIGEADDSSEPITEEWLLSVGLKHDRGVFYLGDECIGHSDARHNEWWLFDNQWNGFINLQTRRDVRILCELLRIELKDTK